jgi:hypothetical protein
LIGQLPETLSDRAIPVNLERRSKAEQVQPMRKTKKIEIENLRRKILRWVDDHREEIAFADALLPDVVNDRMADNWAPLFKIAKIVGGDWPDLALKALSGLNATTERDGDFTAVLLASLRSVFEEEKACRKDGFLATDLILERLNADREAPWADLRAGQGLSAKRLGDTLRGFGIRSVVKRTDPSDPRSRRNGHSWERIGPVVERYVPNHPGNPQTRKPYDASTS